MFSSLFSSLTVGTLIFSSAVATHAAIWSSTSVGARFGSDFAEPYKGDDITKQIFNLTHASGDKYGSNFFNVDLLQSNDEKYGGIGANKDDKGTQEAYIVLRRYMDAGAVLQQDFKVPGMIKGVGVTGGLDWNTKNDAYGSKKRMWVLGPTVQFDVPAGFLDLSVFAFWESNDPTGLSKRYSYDTHPAVQLTWGLPIAQSNFSFEGFALWIDQKGKDEFGGNTKAETNIDAMLMYNFAPAIGLKDKKARVGFEYQYWKNKFGNNEKGAAGAGATASTPMIRLDYQF